jgi:raffinose/stachyose/melibiose transport system substrate-binding protein
MKKKFLAVVLSLAAVLPLAGCNKSNDDKVILLNFKPEIQNKWQNIIDGVKKDLGITLEVQTAASGKYEDTFRANLSTKNSPAIFQINGLVGYNKWKDYIDDLDDTNMYKSISSASLAFSADGKVKALPVTEEGIGIIYNKALTDKYFNLTNRANTGANSMDDVKSYTTLKAVVEDMQNHKADLGIDGVFCPSGMGDDDSWRITGHAFNMPLVQEFGALTETPSEIKFSGADQYRNLLNLYVKNSTVDVKQMAAVAQKASFAEFQTGKAVMVQNGQWATSGLTGEGAKASDLHFLPMYCGLTNSSFPESSQGLSVGTEAYWCVNKSLSDTTRSNAKKVLDWLFAGNGEKYVVSDLGFNAPYKDFATKKELAQSDPLSLDLSKWMAKDGVKSLPWDFNYVPSVDAQRADLVTNIKAYYNSDCSDDAWNTLVTSAKSTWKTLAASAKA